VSGTAQKFFGGVREHVTAARAPLCLEALAFFQVPSPGLEFISQSELHHAGICQQTGVIAECTGQLLERIRI
jgi:hypothetical protein